MAAKLVQELQNEIVCSICKHYYTNPVTVNCGHTFCRECFIQDWEGEVMYFSCPECKFVSELRHFPVINVRLDNATSIGKELRRHYMQNIEGQGQCPTHQKLLKIFCEEDKTELCVVCSQDKQHQDHKLRPIEKATCNNMNLLPSFTEGV